MSGISPSINLYSTDGYELAVQNNTAIPSGTRGLLLAGSDGILSKFILIDGSSRQVCVGAGTAGSPVGGIISIQGVENATPVIISDPAEGSVNLTAPNTAIQIAGLDGYDLRVPYIKNTNPTTDDYGLVVRLVNSSDLGADVNIKGWFGATTPTVGQKTMAASIPITWANDQSALPIGDNRIGRIKITDDGYVAGVDSVGALYVSGKSAVGSPPSSNPVSISGIDAFGNKRILRTDTDGRIQTVAATIPGLSASMINLTYRKSDGAIVANNFKRVITYTIPAGYSGYLIRFTTWQEEAAYSRFIIEKNMGTLEFTTNTYISGLSYFDPQFASVIEAEVTTQLGSANNVTVTVTYTNEYGVASRTGSFTLAKSSIVGTRINITLQTGDLGIRSIQNLSVSPSGGAGAVKILGFIQLAWHDDLSTTTGTYTDYAPSAISFPAGTIIGIEYSGGVVSKTRILGALVQLVQ